MIGREVVRNWRRPITHKESRVMEGYLNIWLNVATVLALAGIAVWMTLLPSTTFFGDDD